MTLPRWPLIKTLCLLLALSVLLAACSRVGLAYRNLDWLIPWRLDDYLSLTSTQKTWLKPRLQTHLAWHCSSELPRYIDWLQRSERLLQQAHPSASQLNEQFAELDGALKRVTTEITPTAIELLQTLNPRQVADLYAAMDEDNRADRQEFLEPPLTIQISQRAARMQKRLRPWFGRLNDTQQTRIGEWAQTAGEQNRLWLDNRLRWQTELRTALDARRSADFPVRLTHLLQERESVYQDDYRAAYARSRQALAELFSDLLASADNQQRERLSARLRALRRDLAGEACTPASRVAASASR
jgi:septal ring factor EnvC (AmiA/AmiB activator)